MSGREIFAKGLYVSDLCRETFSETPHTIISSNNFFLKEISKILGKPSEQARASKNSSQQCEIIFFEIVRNNIF
jgi:hypothetical protein